MSDVVALTRVHLPILGPIPLADLSSENLRRISAHINALLADRDQPKLARYENGVPIYRRTGDLSEPQCGELV